MAKFRFVSLLPAYSQTPDLKNFFSSTLDEVFQPGETNQISGYIGRVPAFYNPVTDFYIGEPTASRAFYQLEAGMISTNAASVITNTLTYPDLINYLMTSGANVTNHQRLFETEYCSWAPPINIDMLVNFIDYYWFGDATGSADLPSLVLTVPMSNYTGDGVTKTFALPDTMLSVPSANEIPSVFVNDVPVSATVSGSNIVCASAPASGTAVLVCRTPSLASVINGLTTVNVSDINSEGVEFLTSGMRVKIIDPSFLIGGWDAQPWDYNLWDFSGSNLFMVDGVGQTIRLTLDTDIVRGLAAQYVTIDRSSSQENGWSNHNSWVHVSSFAWSGQDFTARKAERPIIEFIRDLVIYPGSTWNASAVPNDPLFMLYDLDNIAFNDPLTYPGSTFAGNRIFGYELGTFSDPLLGGRLVAFDGNGYLLFQNDAEAISYQYGLKTITSMVAYATETTAEFIGAITGTSLTVSALQEGTMLTGQTISGTGVPSGSTITAGSGGVGIYTISTSQSVGTEEMTASVMRYSALWHAADGTTTQTVTNGFYNIPSNLQGNPSSEDVSLISQSTWIDHFQSLLANQAGFVGQTLGINNYRDSARDLSVGTAILKHRAPLLKAMLIASDESFDMPQAIRYVDQEYNRFRNKFIRALTVINNNGTLAQVDPTVNPSAWVAAALASITRSKSLSFPFALNTIGGGQYFIPATPTALGVLSAVVPAMVTDYTYATPVLMIQGHDGSLTPAFNDWRDGVLLALETQIYQNLPAQFQTDARPMFDIYQWIGNAFGTPVNGYSYSEFNAIMSPLFQYWAQSNQLDYRANLGYDPNNSFTWNFNGVVDILGNTLPGNWRAIYHFYYGTDAPHTRPWEMLGFVSQPTWWVGTYGAAPYTSANTALWADLENGNIAAGIRIGIDPLYARPGLSNLLPVNVLGNLLDPFNIGIVIIDLPAAVASRPWAAGDLGPVEYIWTNSPSYRFSVAIAAFLMKPARFMEECWDSLNIGYVATQWVEIPLLASPLNSLQYVHGETTPSGTTAVVTGVQQWVADYLLSTGVSSSGFGNAIRGLDVRLIHQMATFVSTDNIKATADNFGLLPEEDVNVVLYTSPSSDVEVYSGVIMEWTGSAWRAIGYDARNSFFTIIPPDPSGPKGLISLATASEPSIVTWRANTYYPTGILASYLNSVYQCLKSHTSGPQFENTFWMARPDLSTAMIRAPSVITYGRSLNTVQQVPYGTEFSTYQEVANFLLGWQSYLVSRGWVFNNTNASGTIMDWFLSVREFLVWAQTQWAPGNFIAMSPGQTGLTFITANGTILNVEDNVTGFFGLLDRVGNPIPQKNVTIDRLDGQISITAMNSDIFCTRLEIASIEHALVFSNVSIFDDDIYLPVFNMRQERLKLWAYCSTAWAGRLDAPGFYINGNILNSNFDKAANDVRYMFGIEEATEKTLWTYARHNIGFQERSYMNDLVIADSEQFEFYQGMIQQKGALGVFQKLMRSNVASSDSDIQFLEEWAFLLGIYGAPIDPFITFQITQTDTRDDPQIVRFVATPSAPLDWIIMPLSNPLWFDKPASAAFFPLNSSYGASIYPVAGPVRLSDVTYTQFYLTTLPDLYATLFGEGEPAFLAGTLTWIYERADGTYTVLESYETGLFQANQILMVQTNNEDSTISLSVSRIFFQLPIAITASDVGASLVVDGTSLSTPDLQGLNTITAVNTSLNYVEVSAPGTMGYDFTPAPLEAPFVRVLREVRFATILTLNAVTYSLNIGDMAWIDDYADGQWAVVQWNGTAWVVIRNQPLRVDTTLISDTCIYAENVTLTTQQITAHAPLVNVVDVIDPVSGMVAGISERDIDFRTDYDPARYNSGYVTSTPDTWGAKQVGRVWWNLSTVKFLDPYTDVIGASNARDFDELYYRANNWAQIAPNTSVDIYEWTASLEDPGSYSGAGTVYVVPDGDPNIVDPTDPDAGNNWVQEDSYDPATGITTTTYYYWVTGLTTVPTLPFRNTDITTVAEGITSPSSLDLSWMSPINSDALIVSGVIQFLNDVDSVMKVRLTLDADDNPGTHDEWILMRPTDETSLPPDQLWFKLRDSLMAFNVLNNFSALPDPSLAPTRGAGIGSLQNMFQVNDTAGSRAGLMDARQIFVESINNILAETPISTQRQTYISTIERSTPIDPNLIWTQVDESYPYEPAPANEWDVVVYSLDQRNNLIARQDFIDATGIIRVLIDRRGNPAPYQGWSIWNYNPTIAAHYTGLAQVLQNADTVFTLRTSYEWSVTNETALDALVNIPTPSINVGDRVLVEADNSGFWAIWKWEPGNSLANAMGFVLWRVQTYRTTDFFSFVDWYASGYSASNPPIITYATAAIRNSTEGISPTNRFVVVSDDGTPDHSWIWTMFDGTTWNTVALENGTIALSSDFYNPLLPVHGVNSLSITDITNRDGTWEIYILAQALRYAGLLIDSEINQNWFDMVNFCHAQQADVAWAFKTSFMTIAGYNVPLEQTPYLIPDPTADLIDYINEVKPYHVKIREYSTQYSLDMDDANGTVTDFDKPVYLDPLTNTYRTLDPIDDAAILATLPWSYWFDNYLLTQTPVRGFNITIIFDRYDVDDSWDTSPWDSGPWDTTDSPYTSVYVHTTVVTSLSANSATIQVDDIRFLQYVYGGLTPVSSALPLTINIGTDSYQIAAVVADAVNVSTTNHGVSGTLTTVTGDISMADGTAGNVVEAIINMPSASSRIAQSYAPTAAMNPNNPDALMDLGTKSETLNFVLTVTAPIGATVLTFADTTGILVNQPVSGPNILQGTTVLMMDDTTVTLSGPTVGIIEAGTYVTVDLPNWIDGYELQNYTAPVSEFDMLGFDVDPLDIITDIYDSTYDGSTLASPSPDYLINPPLPSRPGGFDLRSPYYWANHPQERLPFLGDDNLCMIVSTTEDVGGPSQIIKAYDVSAYTSSTATLYYDLIAQSSAAVMVFLDGVRGVLGTDYTVSYFNRTVTVNITDVDMVQIHAFGFGGTSVIDDRNYVAFASNPITMDSTSTTANVAVVENGVLLASGYTVSGNEVTLSSPPSTGTDMALIVYDGGATTATTMVSQVLTYINPTEVILCTFTASNGTLLQSYSHAGDINAVFTKTGSINGEIESDALTAASAGVVQYQATTQPSIADYVVNFNVDLTGYTSVPLNGSIIYAIGRANGSDDGYQAAITSNGLTMSVELIVMPSGSPAVVSLGTLTSGVYMVSLALQGTSISVAVQRSEDSAWLTSEATWSGVNSTAISITDSTYTATGHVLIGGTWAASSGAIWFRDNGGDWNDSALANPATGVGGFPLSASTSLSYATMIGSAGGLTFNFGQSSFTYGVPAGFTPGWPNADLTGWTTFDPSKNQGDAALSGGNLTVNNDPSDGLAQSVDGFNTGNFYFEYVNTFNTFFTTGLGGGASQLASLGAADTWAVGGGITGGSTSSSPAFSADAWTDADDIYPNIFVQNNGDTISVAVSLGAPPSFAMTQLQVVDLVAQQWTLNPHDTQTVPEHAGTIVEINGERLAPPMTWYGVFTTDNPSMFLPVAPIDTTTVSVYVNGALYGNAVPFASGTNPSSPYPFKLVVGSPPPTNIAGQFVFFGNLMVALQSGFTGDVAVVLEFLDTTPDYTVSSGVLTINKTLTYLDKIEATIFTNASSMGLQTVVYPPSYTGFYFIPVPFEKSYALVTMNGLALAPDINYQIGGAQSGWDDLAWDSNPWDFDLNNSILSIFNPAITGTIVATIATAQAERESLSWVVSTNTPAFYRMAPVLLANGQQETGLSTYFPTVPSLLYTASFEYCRQTPYMAGSLVNILQPTDTQIIVSLFLKQLAPKLQEPNLFFDPVSTQPGVVWIGGERIEYFAYAAADGVATLSGLRRGTHGTTIAEQRSVISGTATGEAQNFSVSTANGVGPIEVAVDGVPYADFVATVVADTILVELTAMIGAFVTVAMTSGYSYPVGTQVFNGSEQFSIPVPVGVIAGDREAEPMHQIIG